jgi:hypothetical protein
MKSITFGLNVTNLSQISELFDYATSLEPNKPYKEIDFGIIYNYKAQEINQKTGIRLNLAKKKLSSFGIVHALGSHGNDAKETARGQKGITRADFEFIPGILSDFDEVTYGGKNSKGKDSIVFIKKIRGLIYHVVMATSGEGKDANLYFNTMYIKR